MAEQTLSVNMRPGGGTVYPFVRGGADTEWLLGDLFLAFEDPGNSYELPLKIAWMYGFGDNAVANPGPHAPAHARDIVIADNAGTVVFDSTAASGFLETAWGTALKTVQWIGTAGVLRCTWHTEAPSWHPARVCDDYIVPAAGELDARTYTRRPLRLLSVTAGATTVSSGPIVLAEGYNCRLTPEQVTAADGGRARTRLRVRLAPGDGQGRTPPCTDIAPVLRRINGVGPDAGGNLAIDVGGCYRLQRPTVVVSESPRTVEPTYGGAPVQVAAAARLVSEAGYEEPAAQAAVAAATFALSNNCGPCCECRDFVNTYEGVRRLDTRARLIGVRGEAVRDLHQDNIDRWNAQRRCRLLRAMRLLLAAEPGGNLFVGGQWTNMLGGCARGVWLRLTFETYNDGVPTDLSSGAVLRTRENRRSGSDTQFESVGFSPAGEFPVYDIAFDYTDPQTAAQLAARITLPTDPNGYDVVGVTLSVHVDRLADLATGDRLHMPTVSVPTGIAAIWAAIPVPAPCRAYVQRLSPFGLLFGCGDCEESP